MPISDIFHLNNEVQIGVWEITESTDELAQRIQLNEAESRSFELFTNEKRKKEWLAIRNLLNYMDQEASIVYLENGKPRLGNKDGFISLSHTKGWVTIILHKKCDVGCDIERLTEKVIRIKEKFVSPSEQEKAKTHLNSIIYYSLIWSAKEAIYKLFSEVVTLEFKTQISIDLPKILNDRGKIEARVFFNREQKKIELDYHIQPEYVLVYTLND